MRIRYWTHIALMFLLRSGRSTIALSIMMVTAVAVLIFLSALAVGVNDAMLENSVGLFSGHVSGYDLPATVLPRNLMKDGVRAVLKRVYVPGVLSTGKLNLPMTLCGIEPEKEGQYTALSKKTTEGIFLQGKKDEIFISKPVSDELGLNIGSTLSFTSQAGGNTTAYRIVGIYQTHIENLDRGIAFVPLDSLPAKNHAWSAAVFLEYGVAPQTLIQMYKQELPGTCRFASWETQMPDLRQLIDLQYISMAIVIVLVFGVVSVGIGCSFVIFIIKNMREYGIMKAMGVSTREMSLFILMKVGIMNLLACSAGLVLGVVVSWLVAEYGGIDISAFTSHNRYFAVSGIICPRLTLFSLWTPPATALLFSLAAAVWPAVLVAQKKAADIIRMI